MFKTAYNVNWRQTVSVEDLQTTPDDSSWSCTVTSMTDKQSLHVKRFCFYKSVYIKQSFNVEIKYFSVK